MVRGLRDLGLFGGKAGRVALSRPISYQILPNPFGGLGVTKSVQARVLKLGPNGEYPVALLRYWSATGKDQTKAESVQDTINLYSALQSQYPDALQFISKGTVLYMDNPNEQAKLLGQGKLRLRPNQLETGHIGFWDISNGVIVRAISHVPAPGTPEQERNKMAQESHYGRTKTSNVVVMLPRQIFPNYEEKVKQFLASGKEYSLIPTEKACNCAKAVQDSLGIDLGPVIEPNLTLAGIIMRRAKELGTPDEAMQEIEEALKEEGLTSTFQERLDDELSAKDGLDNLDGPGVVSIEEIKPEVPPQTPTAGL